MCLIRDEAQHVEDAGPHHSLENYDGVGEEIEEDMELKLLYTV